MEKKTSLILSNYIITVILRSIAKYVRGLSHLFNPSYWIFKKLLIIFLVFSKSYIMMCW